MLILMARMFIALNWIFSSEFPIMRDGRISKVYLTPLILLIK